MQLLPVGRLAFCRPLRAPSEKLTFGLLLVTLLLALAARQAARLSPVAEVALPLLGVVLEIAILASFRSVRAAINVDRTIVTVWASVWVFTVVHLTSSSPQRIPNLVLGLALCRSSRVLLGINIWVAIIAALLREP